MKHDGLHARRKSADLVAPVRDDGGRRNDKNWLLGFLATLFVLERLEERKRLHRLPQSHLVRKYSAELKLMEEVEPADALLLVVPKLSDESLTDAQRLDLRKRCEFLAQRRQPLVESNRESLVVDAREADSLRQRQLSLVSVAYPAVRIDHAKHRAQLADIAAWNAGIRAAVEACPAVSVDPRVLEERRQRKVCIIVDDRDVAVEPVDGTRAAGSVVCLVP